MLWCVSVCVYFQASPRLSVLTIAPTKQTETASASLHAWNPARPNHAWLLCCVDARECNNRLQRMFTHWGHRTLSVYCMWVCCWGCFLSLLKLLPCRVNQLLKEWRIRPAGLGFKLLSLRDLEPQCVTEIITMCRKLLASGYNICSLCNSRQAVFMVRKMSLPCLLN